MSSEVQQTGEPDVLESALLRCATAMIKDPAEARALVAQTLQRAADERRPDGTLGEVRMFRMLRETYHSIERSRGRRPARDAVVTAMAVASRTPPAEQPG